MTEPNATPHDASAPATDTAALLEEWKVARQDILLSRREIPDIGDDLAAALRASERELQSVDGVLARRPALAAINGRAARIEHAINVAKRCDDAEADRDRALAALAVAADELHNIATVDTRKWEDRVSDDFEEWARSRARHTLSKLPPRPSPKEASE